MNQLRRPDGLSRRGIGGWAMELVNGHESFFDAELQVCARFKFALAPCLVSGELWSTVRKEQRAFGGLYVSSASEKGFAFTVREGCRELASEVGRVSERTRFKRSSGPSVPGRVRFAPSRRILVWKARVRTSMRHPLPEGRVARTSLRFRCNFWIPRNGNFGVRWFLPRGERHSP